MKRLVIAFLFLLAAVSLASADPPFTRRSSQVQHDGLKQYYEIPNFRLGGKYDLGNPAKWVDGGEGGVCGLRRAVACGRESVEANFLAGVAEGPAPRRAQRGRCCGQALAVRIERLKE